MICLEIKLLNKSLERRFRITRGFWGGGVSHVIVGHTTLQPGSVVKPALCR